MYRKRGGDAWVSGVIDGGGGGEATGVPLGVSGVVVSGVFAGNSVLGGSVGWESTMVIG